MCVSFFLPLLEDWAMKAREAGIRETLFIIHKINNNNNYALLDICFSNPRFWYSWLRWWKKVSKSGREWCLQGDLPYANIPPVLPLHCLVKKQKNEKHKLNSNISPTPLYQQQTIETKQFKLGSLSSSVPFTDFRKKVSLILCTEATYIVCASNVCAALLLRPMNECSKRDYKVF